MDFVDLIRLDGAVQVSGGVAGGPHAAFADDAAERTLGRIVYRRGEASEVSAKAQRDVYLGFLWDCFVLFAVKMAMNVPHVVLSPGGRTERHALPRLRTHDDGVD